MNGFPEDEASAERAPEGWATPAPEELEPAAPEDMAVDAPTDAVEPEPEAPTDAVEPEPEAPTDAVEPEPEAPTDAAPTDAEAGGSAGPTAAAASLERDGEADAEEQELETAVKDPFQGPGEWYVVHTYAGYENKVKANLESRIHTMQMEDKIFDVHIPMEDVMEIKSGKKQVVQRKVFPGYLLVKMIYDNDSWYVVRNTPGVTGFVAAGTGSKPTPLSRREVEKILAVK